MNTILLEDLDPNELKKLMSALGRRGANATFKRYGRDHYVRMANKRWAAQKKHKGLTSADR